jgi:hypothetical protein
VLPPDHALTIKPPRWGLVFSVAWIGFLCLLMVAGAAGEHDARGLLLVFLWLPWLVPVALIARSRLIADGDILTYRSPLRTRAWRRSEIGCFAIIPSPWPPRASRLYLHTAAGQWIAIPITGTAWPRGTAQQRAWLTALEEWRSSAGQQSN